MTKTTIFARARAYNADYLTEETRQLIAEGEPVLVATLVRSPWASRPHRLVVLKNSERTNPRSGKAFLVGKVVRPEFKEVHKREWKKDNPGARDVVEAIIDSLNTEARFQKAVQALNEAGELVNAPQDIGNLMRQVKADTLEEERDWIASRLIAHFMPTIERGIGRGLPEWYKDRLIEALPTVPVTDFSLEADCGSENIETEENDCAS